MKILGLSNPNFIGVTIATKAVTTDYLPVSHIEHTKQINQHVATILAIDPDVLVIGGWSKGYLELLTALKDVKHFPVVSVYHSTPFHGTMFGDEIYWKQFQMAYVRGLVEHIAFVQPQTAEYYQRVKKIPALFVPHSFKPHTKEGLKDNFEILISGGRANPFKNTYGAVEVAKDYADACEAGMVNITAPVSYDRPHAQFLTDLNKFSLMIHISHIECYPNTVQEGWARGIPVITSPASNGLIQCNPLLEPHEIYNLSRLQLTNATDAMELYHCIEDVHEIWEIHSEFVYNAYKSLFKKTERYLAGLYRRVSQGYNSGRYDSKFFTSPFSKEGIPWTSL